MDIVLTSRWVIAGLAVCAAGCSPIQWETSAARGLELAAQTRSRALIEFVSTFDRAAARMDEEVFADKNVQTLMREFVPIRLNVALNRKMVEQYGIRGTPTFVVLRPDQSVAGIFEGTMTAEQFRIFLIKHRLK
ncbi:MAG: thioredoxin family protein [Phycisphaerae bacterium]|jgi:thioredoxin-related protein